jgi:mediator of RNA polymerase II transcription subunit 14
LASNSIASARIIPGMSIGFHPSHRELNTAGYGFSDDGGYGGVWVPLGLGCLKKVLRGTLRYLGVVWLFAQFPNIIKEVLATHLKENEGALLHHDPDTPSLRFYIQ